MTYRHLIPPLLDKPMTCAEIAAQLGKPQERVKHVLRKLCEVGQVCVVGEKRRYGGKANWYAKAKIENTFDWSEKALDLNDLMKMWSRKIHNPRSRGMRHHKAKLTDAACLAMRKERAELGTTYKALGIKWRCGERTAYDICKGRTRT